MGRPEKGDFAPVVSAFRSFTGAFACDRCNEMYFVAPNRGKKETIRCGCGTLSLNLLQKVARFHGDRSVRVAAAKLSSELPLAALRRYPSIACFLEQSSDRLSGRNKKLSRWVLTGM